MAVDDVNDDFVILFLFNLVTYEQFRIVVSLDDNDDVDQDRDSLKMRRGRERG